MLFLREDRLQLFVNADQILSQPLQGQEVIACQMEGIMVKRSLSVPNFDRMCSTARSCPSATPTSSAMASQCPSPCPSSVSSMAEGAGDELIKDNLFVQNEAGETLILGKFSRISTL